MRKLFLTVIALSSAILCQGQVKFAFLTDIHYSEGSNTINCVKACIEDINNADPVDFVMFGGDLTDFGADEELYAVKEIFDGLKYKYYVVAGNHDAKWSESGCNTFVKVFGYEHFEFDAGGWRFLGCNCGPDMRMAPALLPKETMLWLESREPGKKTIFVNHFPQDTSELNYFDVTKALKRIGAQWEIGGHWHANTILNYEGIPAVLCRSTYNNGAGYSIVTLTENHVTVQERKVGDDGKFVTYSPWYEMDLAPIVDKTHYDKDGLPDSYQAMRYDVNAKYDNVREVWSFSDDSNIATGFAMNGGKAYYGTTSGCVRAIRTDDGKRLWNVQLPGKIFSTPALWKGKLVIGCTDGNVYCLNANNGKTIWKVAAKKSIVASPYIYEGIAYIGASDGCFRAIKVSDGSLVWETKGIEGFVESTPLVDEGSVVFGTWGMKLYSLDRKDGHIQWVWKTPRPSRMFSPAATIPVKSNGRIFIAVPDRKVYAIDPQTGKTLFWVAGGREAVALSADGNVHAKFMHNHSYCFPANVSLEFVDKETLQLSDSAKCWTAENNTGYEISPTPMVEFNGVLLTPTDKGNIVAMNAKDGSWLWAHKISIALINPVQVWEENGKTRVLASTMDGKLALLEY